MRLWLFKFRTDYNLEVIAIIAQNFAHASQQLMRLTEIDLERFEKDVQLVENTAVYDLASVRFFHHDGTNYQKEGFY